MVRPASSAVIEVSRPVRKLRAASSASSGSTAMTRTFGLDSFRPAATPDKRPPPETGIATRSTSGRSRRISKAMVPVPAMISRALKGGTRVRPSDAARASALAARSALAGPTTTTSAPQPRVPASFEAGALSGITITARAPSTYAA